MIKDVILVAISIVAIAIAIDVGRSVHRLWDHIDELDKKKARDEKAVRTYEFVLIKRYGQMPEIWHNGKPLKYNGKAEIHCEVAEMRVNLEY